MLDWLKAGLNFTVDMFTIHKQNAEYVLGERATKPDYTRTYVLNNKCYERIPYDPYVRPCNGTPARPNQNSNSNGDNGNLIGYIILIVGALLLGVILSK